MKDGLSLIVCRPGGRVGEQEEGQLATPTDNRHDDAVAGRTSSASSRAWRYSRLPPYAAERFEKRT